MDTYNLVVASIREYYEGQDVRDMFLHGGCYWLANLLCIMIPNSHIMINRMQEHCGTTINQQLYDITGKISKKNYKYATSQQIQFMKKNYIPNFDTFELERYIQKNYVKMFESRV